jgi:hypothetical protein
MKSKINLKSVGFSLMALCSLLSFCFSKKFDNKSKNIEQTRINKVIDNSPVAIMPDTLVVTLIEAKSNKLMSFKEIEVFSFENFNYHGHTPLDFITKIKTNAEGQFPLPVKFFSHKYIDIQCGSRYHSIPLALRDGQIWLGRLKNRFGNTLAITIYDLGKDAETNFTIYKKDTTVSKMNGIKLIAYDTNHYYTEFKNKIIEKKIEFSADQSKLWAFIWSEFENNFSDAMMPPDNCHFWFSTIRICEENYELNINTAFAFARKIKDENKKYYFLDALCWLMLMDMNKYQEPDKKMLDWVDKQVEKFYSHNAVLKLNQQNTNQHEDYLWIHYKAIHKRLNDGK